jgi:hypothetical protein
VPNGDRPERRKHARVKFEGDLTVYHVQPSKSGNIFEEQTKPTLVKIVDISEGGIKLDGGGAIISMDILKINFNVQESQPITGYAGMAWKSGSSCGLQFMVLAESTRQLIKNYVASH